MNIYSNGFVIMPNFDNLKKQKLNYLDALVYISLRSFFNLETRKCNPPLIDVAHKIECTKSFTTAAIKRLTKAGYIESEIVDGIQNFKFLRNEKVTFIPTSIFDLDATKEVKAITILLREWIWGVGHLNNPDNIPNYQNYAEIVMGRKGNSGTMEIIHKDSLEIMSLLKNDPDKLNIVFLNPPSQNRIVEQEEEVAVCQIG